ALENSYVVKPRGGLAQKDGTGPHGAIPGGERNEIEEAIRPLRGQMRQTIQLMPPNRRRDRSEVRMRMPQVHRMMRCPDDADPFWNGDLRELREIAPHARE